MTNFAIGVGLFICACIASAKLGYDFGHAEAKADHFKATLMQARRDQDQRCEDNTVYTKAVGGFWLDTGKKCKVME